MPPSAVTSRSPSGVIAEARGSAYSVDIVAPSIPVARLSGVTVLPPVTKSVEPSGETVTSLAPPGIGTAVPGFPVATVIGVTVLLPWFATHVVTPSGVMATDHGSMPTWIAGPAVFVIRLIGVTDAAFEFVT